MGDGRSPPRRAGHRRAQPSVVAPQLVPQMVNRGGQDVFVLPAPLRQDIQRFQMSGFAELHFRTFRRRAGFIRKKIPMQQMLEWQADEISKSLLQSTKQHSKTAVSIFKQIQALMGDRTSKKRPAVLAKNIVTAGINTAQLRDEIYCQLVKQTTANPNLKSATMGWKIFAMCCAGFPSTRGFQSFVLSHFVRSWNAEGEIGILAPWCYWRLSQTNERGPEPEPMTLVQVNSLIKDGIPPHQVC